MDSLGRASVADVSRVERELAELWARAATEDHAVVRACAMNLVVVCSADEGDLAVATRLVARMSETAPGRALVVARSGSADRRGGLDVYVSANCHRGADGALVCSEQVTLEARDDGVQLVPETVLQLLVEDMPVYTWWRPANLVGDPLLGHLAEFSERLIVDAACFDPPAAGLAALESISRGGDGDRAADVEWARTEPWREALASFFDDAAPRERLERISRVEVVAGGPAADDGRTAAAAYLGGWLATRLGWSRQAGSGIWQRPDGGRVEVVSRGNADLPAGQIGQTRIETEGADAGAFLLERAAVDREYVRLWAEPPLAGASARAIKLPARDDAALVCGILQRTEPDPIFAAALREAAR